MTQKFKDSCVRDLATFGKVTPVTLSDITPYDPLVVLCVNSSRLGTDIDDATSHLKGPNVNCSKTAIAVIHSTATHALPFLPPTDTLVGQQYNRYGLLVDFFFSPEAVLHRCDLNDKALLKLETFFKVNTRPSPGPMHYLYALIDGVWRFCESHKAKFIIGWLLGLTAFALYLNKRYIKDTTAKQHQLQQLPSR